jgi:hypothetical protein
MANERRVDLNIKLKYVATVDLEVNMVIVKTFKPQPTRTYISCMDFSTAEQVATYILSRKFALNFGK